MIIAIDGPAGSGKSSTARELARRLGFLHLDSGALYRAFAFAACRAGWAGPSGEVAQERIDELAALEVEARADGAEVVTYLGDEALEDSDLRSQEVTDCASKISATQPVREAVNDRLRKLAAGYDGGIVCEGRDMGTVVFPDADLKIFLTASPQVRAERRLRQRGESVEPDSVRAESARLVARDIADTERMISPLRPAPDAEVVDTTYQEFEDQVEKIVSLARKRLDIGRPGEVD